jgi:hypothetical protein
MAQQDPDCAVVVEKEDGSRGGGCAAHDDRAHVVPAVEATTVVMWCGLAR